MASNHTKTFRRLRLFEDALNQIMTYRNHFIRHINESIECEQQSSWATVWIILTAFCLLVLLSMFALIPPNRLLLKYGKDGRKPTWMSRSSDSIPCTTYIRYLSPGTTSTRLTRAV